MVPQINAAVPALPMTLDQIIHKTLPQQGGYSKPSIRHQLYLGNL